MSATRRSGSKSSSTVPLASTPVAQASLSGLVGENATVTVVSDQGKSKFKSVRITPSVRPPSPVRVSPSPVRRLSPARTVLPSPTMTFTEPVVINVTPKASPTRVSVPPSPVRVSVAQSSPTRVSLPSPIRSPSPAILVPQSTPVRTPSPIRVSLPPSPLKVSVSRGTPVRTPSPVRTITVQPSPIRSASVKASPVLTPKVTIPVIKSERSARTPVTPIASLSTRTSSRRSLPVEVKSTDIKIKDYKGIVESEGSVEVDLLKRGYSPKSKVVVMDDKGGAYGDYVVATNRLGQTVYVKLDSEGYVSVQPQDLTMVEGKTATIIPLSVKTNMMSCAGLDVCGVAFECEGGICTLTNDAESLTPKETTLIIVGKQEEKTVVVEDGLLAHPIVRMSDIKANPDLVLENTDKATRTMRNAAYQHALADVSSLEKSVSSLNKEASRLKSQHSQFSNSLSRSSDELIEINRKFLKSPELVSTNSEKYELVMFNLKQRAQMVLDLLSYMKAASELRKKIEILTAELALLNKEAQKRFEGVEYVMQPHGRHTESA